MIISNERQTEGSYACTMNNGKVEAVSTKFYGTHIWIIVGTPARKITARSLGQSFRTIADARKKYKSKEVQEFLDYLETK